MRMKREKEVTASLRVAGSMRAHVTQLLPVWMARRCCRFCGVQSAGISKACH